MRINDVATRVTCRLGDAGAVDVPPAPLVMANLLTAAHLRLTASYRRLVRLYGVLLLGGILDHEADDLRRRLSADGLTAADALSIEGWTTLECRASVHDHP